MQLRGYNPLDNALDEWERTIGKKENQGTKSYRMNRSDHRLFHFRQFSMHHHQSTMKIGTDAVLLGIWADVSPAQRVLDVGTGSGIVALLLASRTKTAWIDAVEIDRSSCIEAGQNFTASPFSDRLQIIHNDFIRFSKQAQTKYDLIISNPPFFIDDLISENRQKTLARHAQSLPYEQLLEGVVKLLNKKGNFSLVLPYILSRRFLKWAREKDLYLQREMLIFPKPCLSPNRVNLQLGFEEKAVKREKFIIRNEEGHFTKEYLNRVDDYYLSVG